MFSQYTLKNTIKYTLKNTRKHTRKHTRKNTYVGGDGDSPIGNDGC